MAHDGVGSDLDILVNRRLCRGTRAAARSKPRDFELLDRYEARFRRATSRGFDGGAVMEAVDATEAEAVALGVDFDQFLAQDEAAVLAGAERAGEVHTERMSELEARTPRDHRPVLRREFDRIGRESYRAQVVTVRELHADLTGARVRDFLAIAHPAARRTPCPRPVARRPRRSSSSSSTSGADPGDGDDGEPEPASASPGARRQEPRRGTELLAEPETGRTNEAETAAAPLGRSEAGGVG